MKTLQQKLRKARIKAQVATRFLGRHEDGQTLGEYGLLLLLIALVAVAGLMLIGNTDSDLITTIANAL